MAEFEGKAASAAPAASSSSVNNTGPLAARELPSAVNTPELLAEHRAHNNGKVRTRFPPEPNGYLHVGHCKSMNMNFELAFEKLNVAPENRETVFRYDDTNPEAESNEYIDSLREDVDWLGWKPVRTTFTSDYFDQLYDFALRLIREGKAYVCHQTKAEIEACREVAKAKSVDPNAPGNPNSPWRDTSPEENLRKFLDMKNGKYASGAVSLRLKMDMSSPNPNMWDQVAYRVKYVPHPHAGDKWCIYPTYDYTHCIIDSLEHIDYSICTLEFEIRRESYFWVLEALNLYRPNVYEMSRLNLTYTMLSKRKLLKLVNEGYMRGWDDPRMPTIKGLRRRGYTRGALNAFCREVGVTRTENHVQYERLEAVARAELHDSSPRVMGVLEPIKVILSGMPTNTPSRGGGLYTVAEVPNFPFDPSRGSHSVSIGPDGVIFIDSNDFRLEDSADYFGLAPGKTVGLKYCSGDFFIRCDEVVETVTDAATGAKRATVLKATCIPTPDAATASEAEVAAAKPKGVIQWVAATGPHAALSVEVRAYSHLFVVEDITDEIWEQQLNPQSEVVYKTAMVDPSLLTHNPTHEFHVQFERLGFYVVDKDSKVDERKFVFNMTVSLKETNKPKAEGAKSRSRKEEQAKQLADKMARMSIAPTDMFKPGALTADGVKYSQFDADGVPTHDANNEPLAKSAIKKLKKEWDKQKRLYESAAK